MRSEPASALRAAREFYREQLASAFRHSPQAAALGGVLQQIIEHIPRQLVDTPDFDALLRECSPGSLDLAQRLGDKAVVLLDRLCTPAPGPWWRDLLNYERACFLQAATTQEPPPWNRPRRGVSSLSMSFSWNMPQLIACLQAHKKPGDDLRQRTFLLFARGRAGKVCVLEMGAAVEKVFRATNNMRTVEQIAAAAGVSPRETAEILDSLAGMGAIVPAMSAEEMTRAIAEREKK